MQEKRTQQLQSFCQGLGIHMHDLELLDMALTHTSYAHEAKQYPKPHHNERIEFLGDSVLSVIVSTYMYKNFPDLAEGQLTKLRAYLVCEGSLYEYAKKIHLGDYLQLGKGEEGFEVVQTYLLGMMQSEIDFICRHGIFNDYKTRLQEYLQRDGDADIHYVLLGSTGPEHNKVFTSQVMLGNTVIGEGSGRTKKDSEQHAAKQALAQLHVRNQE